jgi:hypothetical protein
MLPESGEIGTYISADEVEAVGDDNDSLEADSKTLD